MVAGAACLRSAAVAADSANFVPVGMNCLGLLALLEILEGNPQRAKRLATTAARMAQQLDREDEFHPAAVEVALAWAKAQQSDLPPPSVTPTERPRHCPSVPTESQRLCLPSLTRACKSDNITPAPETPGPPRTPVR